MQPGSVQDRLLRSTSVGSCGPVSSSFHIAHREEIDWRDDVDYLTLGHGARVKVL